MASFLHLIKEISVSLVRLGFSSLSESGFIPTEIYIPNKEILDLFCSHLFQRVASFLLVLFKKALEDAGLSSHLFQRVASFLHI